MESNAAGMESNAAGVESNAAAPARGRRPKKLREEHASKARLKHGKYSFRVSEQARAKGAGRGKGKGKGKGKATSRWVPVAQPKVPEEPAAAEAAPREPAVPACCNPGCRREPWNGQPGEACCRTCARSAGDVHGPDCERRWQLRLLEEASVADAAAAPPPCSSRQSRLIDHLVSSAVQLPLPGEEVTEEPERLSPEEVEAVFKENVPGVEGFLYRQQCGNYSMNFLKQAYESGVYKFRDTELENHFTWLMRKIVHYAEEKKPGCRGYLQEVAEAFMDCQDIQARAVEHVGFQITGITLDFRGLLVQLADEYKSMAMKFLVTTEIDARGGPDDWCNDPVHFENRVVADIGDDIGVNAGDIRRALLDEHKERNRPFPESKRAQLREKFKGFFELDVMLRSFANEANSFSEASPKDSLAKMFIDWVSERMPDEKHLIFDEDTCSRVDISPEFCMAVLEVVFLGGTESEEEFRGKPIKDLFT